MLFAFGRFRLAREAHYENLKDWDIYYKMYWSKFNLSYYGDMTEYQNTKLRRRRARQEFYKNTKQFFHFYKQSKNLKILFFGPIYSYNEEDD
jgi:hypothetical protein